MALRIIHDRAGVCALLWPVLLTGASAATTLVLACATPFAALAALAATRMRVREGVALIVLAWATSQMIGFCVLDYPRDPRTLTWGGAMLTAALAAFAAARWGASRSRGSVVSLATGFCGGFLAYKAALLGWSLVLGGTHVALSPYWASRQFGREALILLALVLLYRGLVSLGMPAAPRDEASVAWA